MFFFVMKIWFLVRKTVCLIFGTLFGNLIMRLWGCRLGGMVRCFGIPHIELSRAGSVAVGRRNIFRSSYLSNPAGITTRMLLATRGNGTISIGSECGFSGTVIVSEKSVEIGDRVLVGAGCVIADTDFHPVDAAQRRIPHAPGACRPVVIEDDVFIGMHCIILKGSHIGAGSVIAAGSVVTGELPAGVVAGGAPAKVIRQA